MSEIPTPGPGAGPGPGPGPGAGGTLYRSRRNRVIGGVCGGIGEYFGIDPTLIRILWVVLSLVYGAGLLIYLILFFLVPEGP
ncbi:MAG: PspC domain-containing protein [Candidatus Thorarchaeota archaeon]